MSAQFGGEAWDIALADMDMPGPRGDRRVVVAM